MNHISIDPGIAGTGIAIWSRKDWDFNVPPLYVTNLMPQDHLDWVLNSERHVKRLKAILEEWNVITGTIEFPQYFQSATGHAATADGKIYKLACLVGAFMGCIWDFGGGIEPVLVNEWKGQLSKDAVIARIKRKCPEICNVSYPIESHSWDAVGIGMWAKGKF